MTLTICSPLADSTQSLTPVFKKGFFNLCIVDIGPDNSFLGMGAILRIVEYLAALLASTK